MMTDQPMVSVVIPTFHRPDVLERTLWSVAKASYAGAYELVVIDDGPSESTKQVAERTRIEFPRSVLRYIPQENAGAARARNRGAQEAQGDVLIFLDDDMVVQPDHLDLHVQHLVSPVERVVNGHWEFAPEVQEELERSPFGRFRLWLEGWIRRGIPMEAVSQNVLRPNMVTACNLGIRRDHFLALGGFDESFPAAGYEDQEFGLRAKRAGFEFIYDRRIALSHLDQRVSLDDFSKRVRQGAFTAGIMARKYPEDFGTTPLISENTNAFSANTRAPLKPLMKRVAASKASRAALRAAIMILERIAPRSRLLRGAYWKWCGIWIYIGVREGLGTAVTPEISRENYS